MTQPELFPQWRETTETAAIFAAALRNAQTPVKQTETKKRQIRPVIDNDLKLNVDRWLAGRKGRGIECF